MHKAGFVNIVGNPKDFTSINTIVPATIHSDILIYCRDGWTTTAAGVNFYGIFATPTMDSIEIVQAEELHPVSIDFGLWTHQTLVLSQPEDKPILLGFKILGDVGDKVVRLVSPTEDLGSASGVALDSLTVNAAGGSETYFGLQDVSTDINNMVCFDVPIPASLLDNNILMYNI